MAVDEWPVVAMECPCNADHFQRGNVFGLSHFRSIPFDGFVAIRKEATSLMPILLLISGGYLMAEHLRYLLPRVLCGEFKRSQWHLLAIWVIVSIYSIYRGFGWLFMYINEQWHQILVTQIFLTAGDVLCYMWLFAGRPPCAANYARGIKCAHLCFSMFEMIFSRNSKGFFGDYGRNTAFILDDGLYLWLFLRDMGGTLSTDSVAPEGLTIVDEHKKRSINIKAIVATMMLYFIVHHLVVSMTQQDLV